MRSHLAGGLKHRLIRRFGTAIEDVFPHRPMQQRRVLRDHANVRTQAVLRHIADRLAVNQDTTCLDIMKAEEKVHH